MRIFKPLGLDGFELCHPARQGDFETINELSSGEPRREHWVPLDMHLIRESEGKALRQSDAPWLGAHALIFRPRVIDALGAVLECHGELLPLNCRDEQLVLFNVTRVVDALDEDASEIERFKSGRVMAITDYVFKPAFIADVDVFKIPTLRVSPTFVSSRIVQLWAESGLQGLEFREVWRGTLQEGN